MMLRTKIKEELQNKGYLYESYFKSQAIENTHFCGQESFIKSFQACGTHLNEEELSFIIEYLCYLNLQYQIDYQSFMNLSEDQRFNQNKFNLYEHKEIQKNVVNFV